MRPGWGQAIAALGRHPGPAATVDDLQRWLTHSPDSFPPSRGLAHIHAQRSVAFQDWRDTLLAIDGSFGTTSDGVTFQSATEALE